DRDGILQYLRTNPRATSHFSAMQTLANADPEAVIDLLDIVPVAYKATIANMAIRELAVVDAVRALAMIDRVATGTDRDALIASLASFYGEQRPEAAVAWLHSLESPLRVIQLNVLRGIARTDPNLAVTLALED